MLHGAALLPPPRDVPVRIPLTTETGIVYLAGRVCRPPGNAPGRLVVINHGARSDAAGRHLMQLWGCGSETARWFLARGDVVLFALRRGYGATGGPWAEDFGGCAEADYQRAGLQGARDIAAMVAFGTRLPFTRPHAAIVIGQSAGGWATIAYDTMPHPQVDALINMAGGRGSHQNGRPNSNCHPERLVQAAATFGAAATTPMLWVYAQNDSFFGPALARALHQAFIAAGGRATLIQTPPYAAEGHRLFFGPGGSGIWGPAVSAYLAEQPAVKAG